MRLVAAFLRPGTRDRPSALHSGATFNSESPNRKHKHMTNVAPEELREGPWLPAGRVLVPPEQEHGSGFCPSSSVSVILSPEYEGRPESIQPCNRTNRDIHGWGCPAGPRILGERAAGEGLGDFPAALQGLGGRASERPAGTPPLSSHGSALSPYPNHVPSNTDVLHTQASLEVGPRPPGAPLSTSQPCPANHLPQGQRGLPTGRVL